MKLLLFISIIALIVIVSLTLLVWVVITPFEWHDENRDDFDP